MAFAGLIQIDFIFDEDYPDMDSFEAAIEAADFEEDYYIIGVHSDCVTIEIDRSDVEDFMEIFGESWNPVW